MNFKKYLKETADPEKIQTNILCQFCGKRLDQKDMQNYKLMNQGTYKLCNSCQNKINNMVSISGTQTNNKNTPSNGNPEIKLGVWGNREQMF